MNAIYINIISYVIAVLIFLFLAIRQIYVTFGKGHMDAITPLRIMLLVGFSLIVITFVPGLIYQSYRAYGIDDNSLRNVSSITTAVNRDLMALLMLTFVYYKIKEDS